MLTIIQDENNTLYVRYYLGRSAIIEQVIMGKSVMIFIRPEYVADVAMQLLHIAGPQPLENAPKTKPILLIDGHGNFKLASGWDEEVAKHYTDIVGWLPLPEAEVTK